MKDNCSLVKLNLAESGPEKLNVTESPSGSETEIVVTFVAPSSTVRLVARFKVGERFADAGGPPLPTLPPPPPQADKKPIQRAAVSH